MKLFGKIYAVVLVLFLIAISLMTYLGSKERLAEVEKLIVDKHRLTGSLVTSETKRWQSEGKWPFDALKNLADQDGFLFWWIVTADNTIYLANEAEFIGTDASTYFQETRDQLKNSSDAGQVFLNGNEHYGIYVQAFSVGNKRWSFWLGFSTMAVHHAQQQVISSILLYSFSTLVVLGIVLFFMVRRFLKPLNDLNDGVQKIGGGDLDFQLVSMTRDEVGQLAKEINQMAVKLKAADEENKKALESARQLADNLDNLPNPALTINRDFEITFINKAAAAMAGLPPDQCVGRHCHEILNNSHCRTENCRVAQAMREDRVFQAETTLNAEGREVPIRYLGAPIHDENGAVVGALESFVDVTELQNALAFTTRENKMREGEILLNDRMQGQLQLEDLCDRILIALCRQLNVHLGAMYIVDEYQSLQLTGSYATRKDVVHVSTFAMGEGVAGQAAMQKETLVVNDIPGENIKFAGAAFEAQPVSCIAVPLLHEGQLKGVIELGSFSAFTETDIDFLNRVASPISVAIDSAQIREHVNLLLKQTQKQAEELQTQQEELQSSNEELEEQTRKLLKSEKDLQAQQEELHATNEELEEKTESLEKQKKEIEQQNRELERSGREIEKKAEELALASRYKSEFLANMSHELRTPLNSLLLLARNLANNRTGNLSESQIRSADTIYSSGTDLLELINEILDLSKIEAGRVELSLSDVKVEEFAEGIRVNFEHLHEDKGIGFSVHIDPHAPDFIRTDRQRLDQVIKNLLSNALKFTNEGKVDVSIGPARSEDCLDDVTIRPKESLAIRIKDTGIGIPEEKQGEIFQAFQQADGSTSRQYGGTGLGLSISRELSVFLGGSIHLKSVPGKGSVFTLIIPIQLTDKQILSGTIESQELYDRKKSEPTRPAISLPRKQPVTITQPEIDDDRDRITEEDTVLLIIEDDPKFCQILLDQGREKGFLCVVALNGEEGLACAEKYCPSAILLDIMLPGIDGWSVLEDLKSNQVLRHIPVHIISALDRSIDGLKKGVIGYLTKPVSPEQLEGALVKLTNVVNREFSRLLIVEDDTLLQQEIAKLIGNGDVQTTTAASGAEVLELVKTIDFDCIILDIGLPDMSGFQLLDKLQEIKGDDIPPVIIYTGRELTKDEEIFIRRYTDSVIIKGVKSEERLLDETALFLHRAVSKMDRKKRKIIANLYEQDEVFVNKNILLVDDDMRTSFAMCQILEERGMNVLIADNGQRAIEILDSDQKVDLVLMDIMMPGIDGYETMAKIREKDSFWNLPIIALTAKAMPGDKAKCMEAGANDYLAKPVEEGRLLTMLRIWLYQ